MKQNQKIKRAIQVIDDFLEDANKPEFDFFAYRDSFYHVFYVDRFQLYEEFKDVFPPREIGKIGQFLKSVTTASGFNRANDLTGVTQSLKHIKSHLVAVNFQESLKVFYSWQSDLPNNTNRGFIEKAIQTAIREINEKHNINIEFDSDTRGEPGSPDISNTILQKIKNSLIFIGDVSYVTHLGNKGMPNSNVMFELGYAISVLTDKNVIMLFNEISGELSKMPFDLGLKRQLVFSCTETDNEKTTERKKLINQLTSRIETILKNQNFI